MHVWESYMGICIWDNLYTYGTNTHTGQTIGMHVCVCVLCVCVLCVFYAGIILGITGSKNKINIIENWLYYDIRYYQVTFLYLNH